MPILWQFKHMLQSFDTVSSIQVASMDVTEQYIYIYIYIYIYEERFPPEYKNSDTHWDFFLTVCVL